MAVRNASIDYLNRKQQEEEKSGEGAVSGFSSCDEFEMLSQDVYHQIHNAIKELPRKSKEVIMMSMNELSIADIQEELKVSKNTVKTNKRRAYAMLREKLRGLR